MESNGILLKPQSEELIKRYCSGLDKSEKSRKSVVALLKKKYNRAVDKHNIDLKSHTLRSSRFCKEYLDDSEGEIQGACPPVGERRIFVVDFLDRQQVPFEVDKKYCKFETKRHSEFKYNIVYIPIAYEDNPLIIIENYTKYFFDLCNSMVIYFQQASIIEDPHTAKLNNFLSYMKMFPISRTLFCDTKYSGLASRDGTRIINIKPNPKPGFVRMDIFGKEVQAVDGHFRKRPARLSCADWFIRFLSTAFECGKGRLVQYSGTCYMTAVVNILILGNYMRYIMIGALNKYVRAHPEDVGEITRPIVDPLPCPKTEKSKILYISRYIYNLICKKQKPGYREDIFIEGSKEYFYTKISKDPGIGGFAIFTMYHILSVLGINFAIHDGRRLYSNTLDEAEIEHSRRVDVVQTLTQLSELIGTVSFLPIGDYDCVMGLNRSEYLTSNGFVPDCAIINVVTVYKSDNPIKPGSRGGHALMGFRCNNIFKIYDSNSNTILDYNWYEDDLRPIFDELVDVYKGINVLFDHFEEPTVTCVLYTNSKKHGTIMKEGSVCLI